MKNVFLLLLMMGILTTGQSQIIQLEETDVRFSPKIQKMSSLKDGMVLKINEEYAGEFSKNPLLFMQENFNIQNFIDELNNESYNYYVVDFRSSKGKLEAWFDGQGNLIETTQRFKNVALPRSIAHSLVKDYEGWTMTRNIYKAFGDGEGIASEKYIIRLKNGNKNQTLRISPEKKLGVAAIR